MGLQGLLAHDAVLDYWSMRLQGSLAHDAVLDFWSMGMQAMTYAGLLEHE
jgi:ABC-type transporter Mla MlaB component